MSLYLLKYLPEFCDKNFHKSLIIVELIYHNKLSINFDLGQLQVLLGLCWGKTTIKKCIN